MTRVVAATLLAAMLATVLSPAAGVPAQAAEPFPEVSLSTHKESHGWANLAIVTGVVMIGSSFAIADRANQTYDDYLAATDPAEISDLYDQTVRYDRFASAALLGGEVVVAVGLYARFLRPPPSSRVQWSLGPTRCALALRF